MTLLLAGCAPAELDLDSGQPETVTALERRQRAASPAKGRRLKPPRELRWRFGPEQRRLAAWGGREVVVMDLEAPAPRRVVQGWSADVEDVLLSRDGHWVGAVLSGGVVEVRDLDTWELRGSVTSSLAQSTAALSNAAAYVALSVWSTDEEAHTTEVWRIEDGVLLSKWDEGYGQLVFMPGDRHLVGTTGFSETVSARRIDNGRELWRFVGGSSECAVESPITLGPTGTHFAYSACGHALYTQRVGGEPRMEVARADGCGDKHVWVDDFGVDDRTVYAGNALWQARFDARVNVRRQRLELDQQATGIMRGPHMFWLLPDGGMRVTSVATSDPVVELEDVGVPSSDGRFVVGYDAIYTVATGHAAELPFDLLDDD